MTLALLARLPTPPPKARVLDACCGSGTIAAALHARAAALKALHVLDADAVAIAAARENVPAASAHLLCDGWPHAPSAFAARGGKPLRYDWIVSNPPVHRGQPDDFRVVLGLVRGGYDRLRKGGVLWMVAQQQVPIGRMLAADGRYAWVRADVSACGRFVVWSAGRGGHAADAAAADEEREEASAPEADADAAEKARRRKAERKAERKAAKKAAKRAAAAKETSTGVGAAAADEVEEEKPARPAKKKRKSK